MVKFSTKSFSYLITCWPQNGPFGGFWLFCCITPQSLRLRRYFLGVLARLILLKFSDKIFSFSEAALAVRATNLPDGSTEAEVRELFKQYGQITHIYVSEDTKTCHVHYNEKESSLRALADLQKSVFYNDSEEVHWNLEVIEHEVQCEYQNQVPDMQHHSGKFIFYCTSPVFWCA